MAPVASASLEVSTTANPEAKGSTQRSIASFFGAKPVSTSTKPRAASMAKPKLSIPALEPDRVQPAPSKRARVGNAKEDDERRDLGSCPVSSDPREKSKNSDWLSNPSPEPSMSVTKCFGRRDRTSMKGGVVAPSVDVTERFGDAKTTCNPESVIGKMLKVFWPLDKTWYAGCVESYNKKLNTHVIKYDDGENESVVLEKEKVRWLDNAVELSPRTTTGKVPDKLSLGRLKKSNSPPLLKRKKVDDSDSLLHELKTDAYEEVGSRTPTTGKKARLNPAHEDDCAAKVLTVTADFFDEVDIDVPEKEEVKVLKRLRKKAGRAAASKENVEVIELFDSEVPTKEVKRAVTPARRLQVEEAVNCDENPPIDSSSTHGRTDFSSPPASTDSEGCKISPSSTKFSESKVKSRSGKLSPTTKISICKDFFSKTGVKSGKPTGAVPISGSAKSDPPCKEPPACLLKQSTPSKAAEADKLTRGELHSNLGGEAAERFGGRVGERFKFLGKGRRDVSGKRPTDAEYDHRTVFLPADFLKGLSGGQRQWWEFKSKHMDKVLLFKMGKFYEMFEMDAHIGAQELDLQYMKGEQPHCGFPEKLYSDYANKLARKGYRVLVVEQTETPDQLEQRKKETGAKDKVVRREVCAVLTKGTIVDGEMLLDCPDAAYLMSITEFPSSPSALSANPDKVSTVGICFVDTSTSHIMVGQFVDDSTRSRLRSVLSELRPVELIKPCGLLAEATERAIKDHTRHPLINSLIPGQEFWDAKKSLKEILEVYASFDSLPKRSDKSRKNGQIDIEHLLPVALRQVVSAGSAGDAALSALGGSLFYLREALLDRTILRLGRVDVLPASDPFSISDPSSTNFEDVRKVTEPGTAGQILTENLEPYMILDSAALENLEILENNRDCGVSGTLLGYLDNCVTPYGRRLLRRWLVRPLVRVESILRRQESVLDLRGQAAEAAICFRKELAGQPDIERLLARLHAYSGASGRNAKNVILYEDAAKKQLQEFILALQGCRALLQAVESFQCCLPKLTSSRLQQLVTPGLGAPDMTPAIEKFEAAFSCEKAAKTGRIVPHDGVDKDFDEANSAVRSASAKLDEYLISQRKKFGNTSEITYVTIGKEAYQMEIPEQFHAKVPSSYEVVSSRKGFRRYWTPEIKELVQDLTAGEQQRELALKGILQGLVKRFCEDSSKWLAVVKSVAEIDVLISLAEASLISGPTCRPTFFSAKCGLESSSSPQIITAKGIRHPTISANLPGGGTFVPNDIRLGGSFAPLMLLTGPNMGGKSTLIRQVCLVVVLAQVGANVTADEFQLSPVDQIFVRMGAKDHIMAGQSTFLVELSETASMLRSATSDSLVALDELGRGTSTSDGQAIAHSVLHHLAHNVGCRGMFSTHYHRLAMHFSSDPRVGLFHMSCKVGTGVDGLEEVLFLYKLATGACPKSYGVNVARLAGMPEAVLQRAGKCAEELEMVHGKTAATRCDEESNNASVSISHGGSRLAELAKEAILSFSVINERDVKLGTVLKVWEKAKLYLETFVAK